MIQEDLLAKQAGGNSKEKPYSESVPPHVLFAPLVSQITSLITTMERLTKDLHIKRRMQKS